jgi:sugar/nucleoside kinase (ribokinase family)
VTQGHTHAQAALLANQAAGAVVAQYGNRLDKDSLEAIRQRYTAALG